MKLGIGSYTFTWAIGVPGAEPPVPMTARGLLEEAVRLGVSVVQYCDNLPLTALSAGELDELISAARERGIALEVGARGIQPETVRSYGRIAAQAGSPFLRVVVDSRGDEPTPEEAVARLRPLVSELADLGIKLAIENHDRFPAPVLARMVEELGPEQVGICLDTVNSFGALEGPEIVVGALAPYCLNLHVKDFTIARVHHQMGFVVEGCPAGQGRLNVPWLIQRLRAAGRDPNAILELWAPPGDTLEATILRERAWAEESIAYLRTLIAA